MKRSHYDTFLWREKGERKPECQDFVYFDPSLDLAVVCDGFGVRGALASATAALRLQHALTKQNGKNTIMNNPSRDEAGKMFTTALNEVNDYITRTESGSTTITGVMFGEDSLYGFSAGDSRIYGLTKENQLKKLTEDESAAYVYSLEGYVDEDEYELVTDDRQGPANYLGNDAFSLKQIINEDLSSFRRILLTTDGIKKRISERELQHILISYPPDEALEKIREKVYRPLDMIIAMIKHTSSHQDFREQLRAIPAIADLERYLPEEHGLIKYRSELDKFIAENMAIANDIPSRLTKDEREQVVDIVLAYREARGSTKGVMDDLGFIIIDLEHTLVEQRNYLKRKINERIPADEVARQLADKEQEVRREFADHKSQQYVENTVKTAEEKIKAEAARTLEERLAEARRAKEAAVTDAEQRGAEKATRDADAKYAAERSVLEAKHVGALKDAETSYSDRLRLELAQKDDQYINHLSPEQVISKVADETRRVEVKYEGYKSPEVVKAEVEAAIKKATEGLHDDAYVQQQVKEALKKAKAEDALAEQQITLEEQYHTKIGLTYAERTANPEPRLEDKIECLDSLVTPSPPLLNQIGLEDVPPVVDDELSELAAVPAAETLDDITRSSREEMTIIPEDLPPEQIFPKDIAEPVYNNPRKNKPKKMGEYLSTHPFKVMGGIVAVLIGALAVMVYVEPDNKYSSSPQQHQSTNRETTPSPPMQPIVPIPELITPSDFNSPSNSSPNTSTQESLPTKQYACAMNDTHQVLIKGGGDGKYYEITLNGQQSQKSIQPTAKYQFDDTYNAGMINMYYTDCEATVNHKATAKKEDGWIVLNEHVSEAGFKNSKLFNNVGTIILEQDVDAKTNARYLLRCMNWGDENYDRFYKVWDIHNDACSLPDDLKLDLKKGNVIRVYNKNP